MSEPWHLGLPGLAVYAAPSLDDGLSTLSELLDLHDQAARTYLEVKDGQALFSLFLAQMDLASFDQAVDLSAAVMLQIIRTVCGPHWQPDAVWLPRREPVSLTPYERYFRAPVYFNSAELSISFKKRWLNRRPETADPSRYHEIRLRGEQLHEEQPQEFVDTLHTAIRRAILTGKSAASDVAANLGVHERTLHRRLTAIGSNFRHELDAVRQCFGEQLLEATNMSVAEIAITLGYTHTSSFIRAFERWCGISPTQWRKRRRSSVAEQALI
jgi:AraC-like DNA-binding protein